MRADFTPPIHREAAQHGGRDGVLATG